MKTKHIEVSLDAEILKKVLEIEPNDPESFTEKATMAHIARFGKLPATEKTLGAVGKP